MWVSGLRHTLRELRVPRIYEGTSPDSLLPLVFSRLIVHELTGFESKGNYKTTSNSCDQPSKIIAEEFTLSTLTSPSPKDKHEKPRGRPLNENPNEKQKNNVYSAAK